MNTQVNSPLVAIRTLGCKVNQYDAETLIKRLASEGFIIGKFEQISDVYIINTCTVTHVGDKKSLQLIRRARRLNPSAFVAVCGCMPRNKSDSHTDSTKKIINAGADFIFDTRNPDDLLAKLSEIPRLNLPTLQAINTSKEPTKKRTRAFIKIQDGCDRFCSYCIVPYVRGPVNSRPVYDILKEAEENIRHGVQEIVLTGIQVASYGYDTGSEHVNFPDLLKQMIALDPKRLRLSSIDPWAVNDDFLEVVANSPTLCSHFHLSLQSGCDRTLAGMNRRYSTADYLKAAKQLRSLRPTIGLTTDVIVGFPGETEEDFQESMRFVNEIGFSHIHVFEYSPRAGTAAADFPDQVPGNVKSERGNEMRTLAKTLKQRFLNAQVGTTTKVLFETQITPSNIWHGHSDNYCIVKAQGTDLTNSIKNVLITNSTEDELTGKIIKSG